MSSSAPTDLTHLVRSTVLLTTDGDDDSWEMRDAVETVLSHQLDAETLKTLVMEFSQRLLHAPRLLVLQPEMTEDLFSEFLNLLWNDYASFITTYWSQAKGSTDPIVEGVATILDLCNLPQDAESQSQALEWLRALDDLSDAAREVQGVLIQDAANTAQESSEHVWTSRLMDFLHAAKDATRTLALPS